MSLDIYLNLGILLNRIDRLEEAREAHNSITGEDDGTNSESHRTVKGRPAGYVVAPHDLAERRQTLVVYCGKHSNCESFLCWNNSMITNNRLRTSKISSLVGYSK